MKAQPISAGALSLIDRRTNRVIDVEPVPDSENPYLLPPNDTPVWHYLRFEYFEKILANQQLRFGRLDMQSDKLDGMYSAENANSWTKPMAALMKRMNITGHPDWDGTQQFNQTLRKRAFVHSWSIRNREAAWMWVTFLNNLVRSVAIRTTAGNLSEAVAGNSVTVLRTPYVANGKPHLDFSYSAPLMTKAKKHAKEQELRLLVIDELGTPEAESKLVPIKAGRLVKRVVVHPECPAGFREEVRKLLAQHEIPAHVAQSRLSPADLATVRRAIRS